ncbi:hypothetical protein ACWDUN_14035 [Mycobacterium sp. NPDC003323]
MGEPGYEDHADYPDFDDDDEIPPRPSKRFAVAVFLFGWLFLPTAAVLIPELASPWFEFAGTIALAFITLFIWACVRVVKNF